ncbi:DUF3265 domain-containing protein [Vibrio parahaemolyticus]|nr:DUF3265 domain-containing protein [Vibrio parahaemolyticus]
MRNAWHFYHALILVIKVVCGSIVLRCSPLKRALYRNREFNQRRAIDFIIKCAYLQCVRFDYD